MRSRRSVRAVLTVCLVASLAGSAAAVKLPFKWARRVPKSCEATGVFYSAQHRSGARPCCASAVGMCPGGAACPPSGTCADGASCFPIPPLTLTNVVLMISDDQGECHYGSAGECRSVQTGTPVRAPATPNLDLLSGYGTVFPVAHNTAPWCFPSLASILTGRYQKSMERQRRPATVFGTVATSLRSLDDNPFLPDDPYNAGNKVGGYCTFLGGKLTGSIGDNGFDARARTGERVFGRTDCTAAAPGAPPRCGSDLKTPYDPQSIFHLGDMFGFLDSLFYRVPNSAPAEFRVQPFFVWYAPRIPHQPLRSPQPILDYLFGKAPSYPLGGLFDLGSLCTGSSCPPTVTAMHETNFGDVFAMFGNVWWMDDGVREIRKYLARASEPHCISPTGRSMFDVSSAACPGTWAASITPSLPEHTVIMQLSDNGWHLPNSKHEFTENGYRTRLIVFDPTALPSVPGWDVTQEAIPPAQENHALVHSTDIYATAVGYALNTPPGSQLCPKAADGTRCDGKDLRGHLATTPGGPAAPESLRRALCGHDTQRSTGPDNLRYLLTREGSVGRCTLLSAPACASDAQCPGGRVCLGGHCMTASEPACASNAACPTGAVCFGGKCRAAPSCTDDADCSALFPGASSACVEKDTRWCRNDPSVRCTTRNDCPPCPDGGACRRLCEPRRLKFYFAPVGGAKAAELSDLFLDPDEPGLHNATIGSTKLVNEMSNLSGPYGAKMQRVNCCVDDWWSEPASIGTICSGGCPADLTCNQ